MRSEAVQLSIQIQCHISSYSILYLAINQFTIFVVLAVESALQIACNDVRRSQCVGRVYFFFPSFY